MKRLQVISLIFGMMALAACSGPTLDITLATPTTAPASSPALPQATATSESTALAAPVASPSAAITPTGSPSPTGPTSATLPDYLDDRSSPSGLILSLFNAINRKEYLRAYSYWQSPESDPNVGTFDQFQKGYQDTDSGQVTLGTISEGRGAGQIYYSVPVVLKAKTTGGQIQTFSGCYTLHLGNPEIQTAPPFHPMGIQNATIQPAGAGADPQALLAAACQGQGGPTTSVPTTDPNTVAAANYLDDRSTPVDVLRSLFNAVNRKEYARAYSYWQNPQTAFPQFEQGYQNTASVEVTFGTVTSDIGAGQIRYRVPVTLKSQTTGGKAELFAGCYQLHLGQPSFQATPPFQPLGIEKALVKPAASEADAARQMASTCGNMQ